MEIIALVCIETPFNRRNSLCDLNLPETRENNGYIFIKRRCKDRGMRNEYN